MQLVRVTDLARALGISAQCANRMAEKIGAIKTGLPKSSPMVALNDIENYLLYVGSDPELVATVINKLEIGARS